jgi:hypothetical protein
MARRTGPSKAFLTRDSQRRWLTLHFVLFLVGMMGALLANRALTPETFWVQWVALGWGLALAAHGVHFARSTLATMGPGGAKR